MVSLSIVDGKNRVLGHFGNLSDIISNMKDVDYGYPEGGTAVVSRRILLGGENLLEISAPFPLGQDFSGVARVSLKRDRAEEILRKERRRVINSVVFMAAMTLLSMWLIYLNQRRHLLKMQEMERRLHHAERLSALGRMAAGVAHEIRNPLNAISMASQRLGGSYAQRPQGNSDQLDQLSGVIRAEIKRLNGIIEEFLSFSKTRSLKFERHDLVALIGEIVLLMREETESTGILFKTDWKDSPLFISMDFDKLKQAFYNIIKNAMESVSGKAVINISVREKERKWAVAMISDTGPGMPPEETEQIFNPDYTTKEKGLGLGLPIAYEIIQGHGGEIRIQSEVGIGTTFEVLLPVGLEAGS
jgi:signal transduction histidine kinase